MSVGVEQRSKIMECGCAEGVHDDLPAPSSGGM